MRLLSAMCSLIVVMLSVTRFLRNLHSRCLVPQRRAPIRVGIDRQRDRLDGTGAGGHRRAGTRR